MKYIKATTVPQEIQVWFQGELESRGIDIVYSHTVMSLLLHPDQELGNRGAAVECLRSATEQKAGLEALVDELCRRLNNYLNPESEEELGAAAAVEEPVKRRSPKELAQMYYAAFPALENSPQVQAQRVSWDGRHIIELHEREQQNAEGANWELMQEQQLRSRLDSPSLVAIWGRQTSAAIETHIFDGFNSVWALSGEDKVMLKVQEDEPFMKGEILFEDVASDDFEPGSLGEAMARIVAKLLDKHNSAIAMFRDDMLFWNWAKYGSDEPILQAMSTATDTTANEAKHGTSNLALFNAGQGDCLAKHPLDVNLDRYLPGVYLHGEHPIGVASGEIPDRHFIGDSNDLLAMGDFTTIPVDDSDEFWGRGFDPTQQFDFLDSDEDDMTTPVESVSRYPAVWPTTTTSSRSESSATYATCSTHSSSSFLGKKAQVKTTVPVSESEQNSVKQKINKREDTWHPTWIEDLLRECPDAEVHPIFSDNSLKMANSYKATGARPKERRMDSSAGNCGSSAGSSNYQLGNMHNGSSQQQESSPVHESFQSEMPAEWPWPWRLGSNGELTTIGPWSPLRDEDRLPPPEARSAYIETIRTELEAEIDELLFNLYELAQPWFQEGSTACAENKDMWSLQQPGMPSSSETGSFIPKPNIGLALPSLAASMPVGFSPENLPLSATIRPPGFVIPTLNFKPQAAKQNSLASSAHSGASEHNHFEPSKYSNKYPASNGIADAKPLSSTNPCVTGTSLGPGSAFPTSVPTALSHIQTVNTAAIGATEKVTHNVAPAHTREHSSSGIMLANSAALATKISASKGVELSGTSGACDKNPPKPNPMNCSAEVSITTSHDSPVPSKIMKGGPTSTVPDSTAAEESSLPGASSLKSIPACKPSSYAPMSSNSSTSSSQYTVSHSWTQADYTALPVHAGNTWKSQVPLIYTSQSYALEFSSSQQRSLPQSASLPNTSLANNSRGTTSDATASAVSSKSSSNISSKPSINISRSYMSEKPFAQTLPPDLSLATAGAPSSKPAMSGSSACATSISQSLLHSTTITATFTNCSVPPPLFTSLGNISSSACVTSISHPLLHSTTITATFTNCSAPPPLFTSLGNSSSACATSISQPPLRNTTITATFTNCSAPPPLFTSLGNISSSACATSISNPLLHNTTITATLTNCSAPPPLLSTSLGNISFGAIPWTFPWLPSNPGHQALSRPPAWHQNGPAPWATHGPRAAPINCNLPGHGNCTLPGHIRVPPPPITRPPACTSVNPHPLQLGPGPVPRPPWPTSWNPSWPGQGQMTWPLSTWPLPPPGNRSPQASISGAPARPMQCAVPPAPWTHSQMRTAVMPPTNTQPTSVCGILGSPSFGQMLRPPHHRPPIAAGNCPYQGQALAGTKTPPKPTIDSLLNLWQRLPPPVATLFPAAPQPGLLNIASIATAMPTASIAASPSLPVLPRSTAVPVTGSTAGPAPRHLAVPPPRHAPKVTQGRCFKPPVGASPKITSINPPPRLPPRLAPRLAAKPSTQPADTLNSESSPDKSDMPETDRPVSQSCKDASQPVPEGASRQPIKTSKDPSETVPEISGRQPTKPCKDTSQAASVPSSRQAITGSPMSCDGKALTKSESTGHISKGGSSCSSCSGPAGQCLPWRKASNFKSSPGVSSHSMHNNEQNTAAPALPEKRRQETFSAVPPYSSGRRKRRR